MTSDYHLPAKIFTGDVVQAAYTAQSFDSFRGNPLLEALPPLLDRQTVAQRLTYRLDHQSVDRQLPFEQRLYLIQEIVNFFEPLPVHLDLERRFAHMIRFGLTARNPLDRFYWHQLDQDEIAMNLPDSQSWQPRRKRSRSTGLGFGIIGDSGVGKTSAVESILSLYPQTILHQQYQQTPFNFMQLTWLMLECPYDGSIRSLCMHFFEVVDDLLNTNYYRLFAQNGRATVEQMRPKIARVAGLHGIGVLVIDEIQNLNQAKSGGAAKMLNFFVGLVNVLGLPVVLIGTDEALPVLAGTLRNARRLSGQGDLQWKRMEDNTIWHYFVESLWRYQYTRIPTPLNRELLDALYYETQGIIDLAVKVYMLTQIRAIVRAEASIDLDLQAEHITPDLIHSSAQDGLSFLQPLLCDIRAGKTNPQQLPYATVAIERFVQAAIQSVLEVQREVVVSEPTSIPDKPAKTPPVVSQMVVATSELSLLQATTDHDYASAYEALQAAGFIRSGLEFFSQEADV